MVQLIIHLLVTVAELESDVVVKYLEPVSISPSAASYFPRAADLSLAGKRAVALLSGGCISSVMMHDRHVRMHDVCPSCIFFLLLLLNAFSSKVLFPLKKKIQWNLNKQQQKKTPNTQFPVQEIPQTSKHAALLYGICVCLDFHPPGDWTTAWYAKSLPGNHNIVILLNIINILLISTTQRLAENIRS